MNNKKNLMKDIDTNCGWKDISDAGAIYGSGNSMFFKTGDWRTKTPVWNTDKCKHCMLCNMVCPDSSIPVINGKRCDFDYEHCKGCGICLEVCHFGAITFQSEKEA